MVIPFGSHCGRSEAPGGVHAGACDGDGEEVAGGDGEADGERGGPLDLVVLVGRRPEHNQHQHHRDQELDAESLLAGAFGDAAVFSMQFHTYILKSIL